LYRAPAGADALVFDCARPPEREVERVARERGEPISG